VSWFKLKRYSVFCSKFAYSIHHYDLEVTLDPRRQSYAVTAAITMKMGKPTNRLCFLLSAECALHSVSYLGLPLVHKVKQVSPGVNLITAIMPRKADRDEKLTAVLTYSGPIPVPEGDTAELSPDMRWYPFSSRPQQYTCTLKVITPEATRIVGPGTHSRQEPADIRVLTQWTADTPFQGIHMLAGDFLKTSRDAATPLDIYYPRKYMNQAKTVADYSQKLLEFFGQKLGPAPAPATAVVMAENPAQVARSSFYLTSISTGILDMLQEYETRQERNMRLFLLLARETGRRWLKYCLPVAHPSYKWYLDGLAEYLSWLAVEEEFGPAAKTRVLQEAREMVIAGANRSIVSAAASKLQFPPWLVAKAAWLMRMAHSLAGDSFLAGLLEIYAQAFRENKAPDPQEFFALLGNITNTDMLQLYREWALSSGKLQVEIKEARTFLDDKNRWQTLFNLVNDGKLDWPHPVELKLALAGGDSRIVRLPLQQEPHLLESPVKVEAITVDPEYKLLNWAAKNTYTM